MDDVQRAEGATELCVGTKNRLLNWIAVKLLVRSAARPYKHLYHADGRPYMLRYWLLKLGKGAVIDGVQMPRWLGARLHLIESSDDDRAYHDHPWWFITIILNGGYWEHRPEREPLFGDVLEDFDVRTWHGPGSILIRRASDWHRLELPEGGSACTVFIHGTRRNGWGFLKGGRKIPWREFTSSDVHVQNDARADAAQPGVQA
jgi:hypothetical protein